jgi:hypothetical protein
MTHPSYDLHTLGWKSFQDLAIAVAEECLHRPIQTFLPSNDAGRDGAFLGLWDRDNPKSGTSTIQCKFTSLQHKLLTVSLLADELRKVRKLAAKGLATDYIIITNHPVSGANDIKIRNAFEKAGAGTCRLFAGDWIVSQIQKSARLRMMVPRLYGLGDLGNILDGRAYEQASMILSAMGDDLKRFVVTDAHRKSVKAITEHNFVLLLGAPAAGKSTIGASLAVGAADIWGSMTIRATSPADVKKHLNPNERQFLWIDDAWGSMQYQRGTIEAWNQILPLIQGAIQRGTQFLLTSRDYIWKAAQRDLKTQALPLLDRSQVIINVQALAPQERAQILYNHLKLGNQPKSFRAAVRGILPKIAMSEGFLPETARRLGSTLFTASLISTEVSVQKFFDQPVEFLLDTIRNLSVDCRAAIALVFLSGGRISSPVINTDELRLTTDTYGISAASAKSALNALDGSLLILAHDEKGRYWTYKHPTIGDAFAQLVANDSELTEVYLRGAKPDLMLREVVCSGVRLRGAPVCVPAGLYSLLLERIANQESYLLSGFLSYRADRDFAQMLLLRRPDLLKRLAFFVTPISEDSDASLLARLYTLGLLQEELRLNFVKRVREAAIEEADASFLDDNTIRSVFSEDEIDSILRDVEDHVLKCPQKHVDRVKDAWEKEYPPDGHFDELEKSVRKFVKEIAWRADYQIALTQVSQATQFAVSEMMENYEPPKTLSAPTLSESQNDSPLAHIFRDVDD